MQITRTMPISDLAERMGATATDEEARKMRDLLIRDGFEGQDTKDVPMAAWEFMLVQAQS